MADIQRQWLDEVGGIPVERITNVRRSGVTADLSHPRKGVLHTTEGGWDGSLSVFRNSTGTPTFMAGRDGFGRIRVAQFMPISEMSLTLRNESGGVETNRECVVQIECVGFSQRDRVGWYLGTDKNPLDEAVRAVVRDLVGQSSIAAGIPLQHAGAGFLNRSVSVWNTRAGWFGHSEVPENTHWDPGTFDWDDLFTAKENDAVYPWIADYLRWRIFEFGQPRPPGVPDVIPDDALALLSFVTGLIKRRGAAPAYQAWRLWRDTGGDPATRPTSAPPTIFDEWWEAREVDRAYATAITPPPPDDPSAEIRATAIAAVDEARAKIEAA